MEAKKWRVGNYFVAILVLIMCALGITKLIDSLLIYKDAQIILNKDVCFLVEGDIIGNYCFANVELKPHILSDQAIVKTKNGRVYYFTQGVYYGHTWINAQ